MGIQIKMGLFDYLTDDEIIEKYKDYIDNYLNDETIPYRVNRNYRCRKCNRVLKNYKCKVCNTEYRKDKCIDELHVFGFFDIIKDRVFIYKIACLFGNYEVSKYEVLESGLYSFDAGLIYPYDYQSYLDNCFINDDMQSFNEFDEIWNFFDIRFDSICLDNIDEISNHKLYKYSYFKECIEYLSINKHSISLEELSLFPVYCKEREYLYKMGLYKLAIFSPNCLEKGKNFKERFKLDKSYLSFMVKNNINSQELSLLQVCPTKNKKIFQFIKKLHKYYYFTPDFDFFNIVNIEDFYKYYLNNKNNKLFLEEYRYYYKCIFDMKLDLKDRKILYPANFKHIYEKITKEYILTTDKEIDEKINSYSKLYNINKYEDDKYIIYPVDSLEHLLDESCQMSNCVRTYSDRISNGECQIYFMREKKNIDKSLVTIEVKDKHIIQARRKFNNDLTSEQRKIVDIFESKLIPISVI